MTAVAAGAGAPGLPAGGGDVATGATVVRVSGPLVVVEGLAGAAMSDLVSLGEDLVPAEVVEIRDATTTLQAYEYTGGLRVGAPASLLGRPLSASLGPHLLGGVFDGLLRPLDDAPTWLGTGATAQARDDPVDWEPEVAAGATVGPGERVGVVHDGGLLEHRVLVPPTASGVVTDVRPAGPVGRHDPVLRVGGAPVAVTTTWPVRRPRPVLERLPATEPLLTGQRVLDAVFPVVRGSTVAVPGGFGTGKTVLLQQIAKWCAAQVIVYVGCGERGNEMADVLGELSALTDPATGRPLAERTVILANTSNMPMMAREASIYSGVTVAEYFRDMGYDAVVVADSTSRWAEALREFASRSGALPAEEGYPAGLSSALAAFYERAGRVTTLGGGHGSVTIVGAVSPPGGDTTEPVTAHTERFVRGVWSLDRDLAYARHYPSVGWAGSFSRDADLVGWWWARNGDPGWSRRRARVTGILAEADRLGELAALVGVTSLSAHDRVALLAGRLVREGVLQQSAGNSLDEYCTAAKAAALVEAVLDTVDGCLRLVDEESVDPGAVEEADLSPLLRAAAETGPDDTAAVAARRDLVLATLAALR
ncbi:V-type ATP synthase subunit A [Pedococcus sp. NPDC057267]|uniref:V-type ATP synthase subunit A n=1 Tax=Pedococcus sp. NPDC057267 TaxID=3346077 RepID=UPI003625592C